MNKEKLIIESWKANAENWMTIIENNGIESRKLATNKAIVDAVCNSNAVTVLDIGCGEGWLAQKLSEKGMMLTGVDIVPELIEKARQNVNGEFIVASYEDICFKSVHFPELFDAIVINFALIGRESTENLLPALPTLLKPEGKLLIQTLHPNSRKVTDDYYTGWKEGSWDGLTGNFTLPYQWYFRTFEDWLKLLDKSGFRKVKAMDVLHPTTGNQLSVIFECMIK